MLDASSAYVKPGGRLIYITCSILPEENAGQVAAFLKRAPQYAPVAMDTAWQQVFGTAMAGHALVSGDGIMLTPQPPVRTAFSSACWNTARELTFGFCNFGAMFHMDGHERYFTAGFRP
ncbi:MAG: hypothetical protein HC779_06185 [Phyllobacteriaceae bacterium]|nr:hypothetical protein [Phyllobacteriaceae bacterium]